MNKKILHVLTVLFFVFILFLFFRSVFSFMFFRESGLWFIIIIILSIILIYLFYLTLRKTFVSKASEQSINSTMPNSGHLIRLVIILLVLFSIITAFYVSLYYFAPVH